MHGRSAEMSCCSSIGRSHHSHTVEQPRLNAPSSMPRAESAVKIPAGLCRVGTNQPEIQGDGESPQRTKRIQAFFLDALTVTNERFRGFVDATGYVTDAERFGWSYVFRDLLDRPDIWPEDEGVPTWWRRINGASWKHPEGPTSSTDGRKQHPVTHISWNDAVSFASWAGGRLPTEAEWEFAAKGGSADAKFPWGDREPDDHAFTPCNIWQGEFPHRNTETDGFFGTSPSRSFAPNAYGLYNMSGNVWEWCSDSFVRRSLSRSAKQKNKLSRSENERVLKGGSYLCHRSYCYRYRIAARSGRSSDTSAAHTGFRVAYD
jgi:formylglycine-generating enzyme